MRTLRVLMIVLLLGAWAEADPGAPGPTTQPTSAPSPEVAALLVRIAAQEAAIKRLEDQNRVLRETLGARKLPEPTREPATKPGPVVQLAMRDLLLMSQTQRKEIIGSRISGTVRIDSIVPEPDRIKQHRLETSTPLHGANDKKPWTKVVCIFVLPEKTGLMLSRFDVLSLAGDVQKVEFFPATVRGADDVITLHLTNVVAVLFVRPSGSSREPVHGL